MREWFVSKDTSGDRVAYSMIFRGRLVFSDSASLDHGVSAMRCERVDSCVTPDDLRLDGLVATVSTDTFAPVPMYQGTIMSLTLLAEHARDGHVMCVMRTATEEDIEIIRAGDDPDDYADPSLRAHVACDGALGFENPTDAEDAIRTFETLADGRAILAGDACACTLSIQEPTTHAEWHSIVRALAHVAALARHGEIRLHHRHAFIPGGEIARVRAGGRISWDLVG
jgi:hypothetical protein